MGHGSPRALLARLRRMDSELPVAHLVPPRGSSYQPLLADWMHEQVVCLVDAGNGWVVCEGFRSGTAASVGR